MLLVTAKRQPLIGIIGIPRSGTTILSNVLNSCDNGYCVVEPIWATLCGVQAKQFKTIKTGCFSTVPYTEIPNRLRKITVALNYGFGAIKETFRKHQQYCVKPITDKADILLCCYREPIANFASWKRTNWGNEYDNPAFFIQNYLEFHRFCLQQFTVKPVVAIVHENLCIQKILYFNNCFKQYGHIDGEFLLKGVDSNYSMGDGRAANSTNITPSNKEVGNINKQEIDAIRRSLSGIYNKFQKECL